MFCRLYEFFLDTKVQVGHETDCTPSCQFYQKDNIERCYICTNQEISLYKKKKFSWTIARTFDMSGSEIGEDDEIAEGIIKLIHPSLQNIWIVRWVSKDKGNIVRAYSVFNNGKETKIENIGQTNWFLKNACSYDGRKLTDNDFTIKR